MDALFVGATTDLPAAARGYSAGQSDRALGIHRMPHASLVLAHGEAYAQAYAAGWACEMADADGTGATA